LVGLRWARLGALILVVLHRPAAIGRRGRWSPCRSTLLSLPWTRTPPSSGSSDVLPLQL